MWKEIDEAARDGKLRRVMCSDGKTRKGAFREPYWWHFGGGAMRLADAGLYPGAGIDTVTHCEDTPHEHD